MPETKIERIAKVDVTLNHFESISSPLGLFLLFLSKREMTIINTVRIRKTQPVRCKKGIGTSGTILNATAIGMESVAATTAASVVVLFQNNPKKNKAKAPGVK